MSMKVNILSLNEPQTRHLTIDSGLQAAGWNLGDRTQVRFEVPVDGYGSEPWNGVTDYCFYDTLWRRASLDFRQRGIVPQKFCPKLVNDRL